MSTTQQSAPFSSDLFEPQSRIKAGQQFGSLSFGSTEIELKSLIPMLIIALAGACLAGYVLNYSSHYRYIYFLQPLIAAMFLRFFLRKTAEYVRMRHVQLATWIACFAGLTAFAAFWESGYLEFQSVAHAGVLEEAPYLTDAEISQLIEDYLIEETGIGGVLGFIRLTAMEGLSVAVGTRLPAGGGPTWTNELFRTNEFFSYAYWLVEVVIFLLVPLGGIRNQVRQPFCEECRKWLTYSAIGHVQLENKRAFLDALRQRDFQTAATYVQDELAPIWVNVGMCNPDAGEAVLQVVYETGRRPVVYIEPTVVSSKVVQLLTPEQRVEEAVENTDSDTLNPNTSFATES
jgi:hypothetical protein